MSWSRLTGDAVSPLVWAKAGQVTPLRQLPEMRHAANNSLTPSRSFRVTIKREASVLTDQSCHRGEARCCGLTLYPQQIPLAATFQLLQLISRCQAVSLMQSLYWPSKHSVIKLIRVSQYPYYSFCHLISGYSTSVFVET